MSINKKNFFLVVLSLLVLTSFASALETSQGNVVAGIWFDNLPTTSSLTVNNGANVAFNVYGLATGSALNIQVDLITQSGTVPIASINQPSQDFNEFGVGSQGDYVLTSTEYGGVGNNQIRLNVNGVVLNLNLVVLAVPVNNAPVFTSTPVTTVQEGQAYSYQAAAFDVDANTLTYSLDPLSPAWLSINSATGLITGTAPLVNANTNYNVVVTVSDGIASVNQPFQITVLDAPIGNLAPTITSAPVISVNENSAYSYQTTATDPENNILTYSLDPLSPAWLSINSATGLITGTSPVVNSNTNYNIVLTVSDGVNSVNQAFVVTVLDVIVLGNNAPVITSTPITNINEDSAYNYQFTATDADNNVLIYSLVANPSWLSINSATGLITGTSPIIGSNINYNIIVRVSDGITFVDQTYTLTVHNVVSSGNSNSNTNVVYQYQDPNQQRYIDQTSGNIKAPVIDLTAPAAQKNKSLLQTIANVIVGFFNWIAKLFKTIFGFK